MPVRPVLAARSGRSGGCDALIPRPQPASQHVICRSRIRISTPSTWIPGISFPIFVPRGIVFGAYSEHRCFERPSTTRSEIHSMIRIRAMLCARSGGVTEHRCFERPSKTFATESARRRLMRRSKIRSLRRRGRACITPRECRRDGSAQGRDRPPKVARYASAGTPPV